MSQKYAGFTYAQVLPLILALLLIFILPMLMRRHGWTWEELFKVLFSGIRKREHAALAEERRIRAGKAGGEREPHLKNGGKNEMLELLSELLTFARRHGAAVVYPGTIQVDGELTTLMALLVMRSEVIGINCYGFAGTITVGKNGDSWNQHMNGADIAIPNPVRLNQKQFLLLRKAMNAHGMENTALRIAGVFTNRDAVLAVGSGTGLMTRKELLSQLKEQAAVEEPRLEPAKTAKRLNELVVRVKAKRGR